MTQVAKLRSLSDRDYESWCSKLGAVNYCVTCRMSPGLSQSYIMRQCLKFYLQIIIRNLLAGDSLRNPEVSEDTGLIDEQFYLFHTSGDQTFSSKESISKHVFSGSLCFVYISLVGA